MEIISSQPFLIVFYRKARFPLPLQRKSSLPQSLPRQEGPSPCERKRTLSLFHHSLFPFLKHPVQKIGESGKYSHHHEKKRIGNHH